MHISAKSTSRRLTILRDSKKLLATSLLAVALTVFVTLSLFSTPSAHASESRNLAPDFKNLPKGAKVVIMPTDIELFSLSAGGVAEPKADWTDAAAKHFRAALDQKRVKLGLGEALLSEADADNLSEINALHAAVANAIALHHSIGGAYKLPTKAGKLDWSMGDAVHPIKQKTQADYALFSWVRDSYASAERKAAMVLLAIAGIGVTGGIQIGYASLVDLNTGQVVWFNQLARMSGDLREAEPAVESVDSLLENFPVTK